jgi:hypothetical protein
MKIKQLKKIKGDVSLLEPIMVIALLAIIIIGAITYFNASTKRADPDFIDIVSFANNLNESHLDKDVVTLTYKEIIPFQIALFRKLDCVKFICKPFNLVNYPTNTYLTIHYKNSNFDSFQLYTKRDSSIFKFNNTPYNEWTSERSYDDFQQDQVKLIEREKKRNKDMNPSVVELTTMFENVSIYNIQDSNRAILFDSSCPERTCTSVLEYKNKPVNPQLADNKKAL